MGKINPDNIDKLFSSLKDQSIEADFEQLDNFEIQLEKKRFYIFGWRHFNIYYVLILLLHSIISIGFLAKYLINTTKETSSVIYIRKDSALTDTLRRRSTMTIEKREENNNKLPPAQLQNKIQKNEVTRTSKITQTVKPATNTSLKKISVNADEVENRDTIKPAPITPAPAKRIIYVKKRDTIIQFDTTKTIRKK